MPAFGKPWFVMKDLEMYYGFPANVQNPPPAQARTPAEAWLGPASPAEVSIGPPPPPPPPPLTPGWQAYWSVTKEALYYYNIGTNVSQWEPPVPAAATTHLHPHLVSRRCGGEERRQGAHQSTCQ